VNELECRQFVEQVTAYLERALTPAEEQAFVEHLAECDGCDRYLDQVRQTTQALDGLPADALPRVPGDAPGLLPRPPELDRKRILLRMSRRWHWLRPRVKAATTGRFDHQGEPP
jgi:anti-sigma factor RsiW